LYQAIIKAGAYANYCTMLSLNLVKVCVVRLPNVLTTIIVNKKLADVLKSHPQI